MRYQELLEMAFSKRRAEQHISGLAYQFNLHLLKLHAFANFSDGLKSHWRKEVKNFLRQISIVRLKPRNRPGSAEWYFNLLYREPFEGHEVGNVTTLLRSITEQYEEEGEPATIPTTTPEEAAAWLKEYHERLSQRLATPEDVSDMVP